MPVEFGYAPVERQPRGAINQWMDDQNTVLSALDGSFKSLWMTDHFFWGDYYAFECWTVLTWIAARWPNIDVGPMVIGQNYRNPAVLAKMAATLQIFSGGRLILGVGAGWKEDEYRAYNIPMPPVKARVEQLEETYEILKRLWTESGKVTYHGQHYHIEDAILEPKPNPRPILLYGGGGEKTMLITAKHCDWWNLADANITKFEDRAAILDRHCESIGRDPATLRKTWFGRLVVGATADEAIALAKSRPGYEYTTNNAIVGTPAQIVEQMSAFVEAGATYFMFDILGVPNSDITSMIVEEIVPKVAPLA